MYNGKRDATNNNKTYIKYITHAEEKNGHKV